MKLIEWKCDFCGATGKGSIPPSGWVEASQRDPVRDKQNRYIFCSFCHLATWAKRQSEYSGEEC